MHHPLPHASAQVSRMRKTHPLTDSTTILNFLILRLVTREDKVELQPRKSPSGHVEIVH